MPLYPPDEWPKIEGHRRTKEELIRDMNEELSRNLVGISWDFSQMIRDNVMESLSGVKGENSVKIIGPQLDELERLAEQFNSALSTVPGIVDPGVFHIRGQSNLAFPVDREKCALWGVSVADVEDVIQTAVGGKPFTDMVEGERSFDVTLRWPRELRQTEEQILDIPVDVVKNNIPPATDSAGNATLSAVGTNATPPSITGSSYSATGGTVSRVPRRRLKDLVTPVDDQGVAEPHGTFIRPGAAIISREQGNRLIAVKFGVRGRDLASAVAEAQAKTASLLKAPYRAVCGAVNSSRCKRPSSAWRSSLPWRWP